MADVAQVADKGMVPALNEYAIAGPHGQRSEANDDLDADYGFVMLPAGVILIASVAN